MPRCHFPLKNAFYFQLELLVFGGRALGTIPSPVWRQLPWSYFLIKFSHGSTPNFLLLSLSLSSALSLSLSGNFCFFFFWAFPFIIVANRQKFAFSAKCDFWYVFLGYTFFRGGALQFFANYYLSKLSFLKVFFCENLELYFFLLFKNFNWKYYF